MIQLMNDQTTIEAQSKEAANKGTLKSRIAGFVELIPFIGKPLAYVVKEFRLLEGVFIILAFLFGWGVVYLGYAPEFLIGSYRQSPPKVKLGDKPSSLNLSNIQNISDWLRPYSYWLEKEADALQAQHKIQGYLVCASESSELSATPEYPLALKASPDYQISAWAFIVNDDQAFKRLDVSSKDASTVRFKVPKVEQRYRLLTVVSITGSKKAPEGACKDFFHASVD